MCFGSGINPHLNSNEETCPHCKGGGLCPTCCGSGCIRIDDILGALPETRRGFRLWLALLGAVLLLVVFVAFSRRRLLPAATMASLVFHERFADAKDDLVYYEADAAFRRAVRPDEERALFGRIRNTMGACVYEGPSSWAVHTTTNGTFVILKYRGLCKAGLIEEKFTWRVVNGQALLVSYRVNSDSLSKR